MGRLLISITLSSPIKAKGVPAIGNLAIVCNPDAMHSSRRIMQITNNRDNHQTSEWDDEGYGILKGINYSGDTRGERLKANSLLDNRFSRYSEFCSRTTKERNQHVRHVMLTSHEICIILNECAKFPSRDINCSNKIYSTTELKFQRYALHKL